MNKKPHHGWGMLRAPILHSNKLTGSSFFCTVTKHRINTRVSSSVQFNSYGKESFSPEFHALLACIT